MKKLIEVAVCAWAAAGLLSVYAWREGWCGWMTAATILLASVIVTVTGLYELTLIERHERREAEAARRSAYREAFFRAMEEDRP